MDAGIADYVKAARAFHSIGQYLTINISCPNTFGGEPFTDPERLDQLLEQIDALHIVKPIFLKLSPDIPPEDLDAILAVAAQHQVTGFICTNLTKNKNTLYIRNATVPEHGGFSGKAVENLANLLLKHVFQKTKGRYVLIGSGGIFSAEDAYAKIRLGATLVQLVTGMVFQGPQIVSTINQGLVRLLRRDGFHSITDAIGVDSRELASSSAHDAFALTE